MSLAPYRGARVVVLGAAGFIGRWVARALCSQGARVHLVVRDRRSASGVFRRYGVSGEILELDLADPQSVARLYRVAAPSATFNLAGYGVDASERDRRAAYRINRDLLRALCPAALQARDSRWRGLDLVHVGSALEYGFTGEVAEDSAEKPTTLYGRSKLAGTRFLIRFCRTRGLRAVTARLFTVYGPGEHQGRLLPSLLRAAQDGQPLDLTLGRQRRDFTFVGDVAEALLRLGLAAAEPGQILNVATGRLTAVRRFVETTAALARIPHERLRFGVLETRAEEMWHQRVPLGRLRRLIGWAPATRIADGIRNTLEFEHQGSQH